MSRADFKKLQGVWYRKLAETGFVDLEKGDKFRSQGWMAGRFQFEYTASPTKWNTKEEYYRLCGVFLHANVFQGHHQRRVWELHTEGMSDLKIAKRLSSPQRKLTRLYIWHMLNKLERKMLYGQAEAEKLRGMLAADIAKLIAARREVAQLTEGITNIRELIAKVDW